MAAMVSASIGDGESSGLKVQEAIWKDANDEFFRAAVLNVDSQGLCWPTFQPDQAVHD
jgi:hypothetical protein